MNPNLNAFLSQIRILLILAGGYMAQLGFGASPAYKYVMIASGAVVVLGNAFWAAWSSYVNWRKASAVGAQAVLNMMDQGKAMAADGTVASTVGPGTTPMLPVTLKTTAEIVKNFAPDPSTIAKA